MKPFIQKNWPILLVLVMVLCVAAGNVYNGNWIWRSNILYVTKKGNDSTASRNGSAYLTITAALNAAQPGDTVDVGPGTYPENDLLRRNVNLVFAPGVNLVYFPASSDTNGKATLDDRYISGGTTNYIYGAPNIVYCTGTNTNVYFTSTGSPDNQGLYEMYYAGSPNSAGAIVVTNANSVLIGDIGDIKFSDFVQTTTLPCAAVNIYNCKYVGLNIKRIINGVGDLGLVSYANAGQPALILTTNTGVNFGLPAALTDHGSGITWCSGECHINCPFVDGFCLYSVWPQMVGALTNEQDFYFTGDTINGKIYVEALQASSSNFVNWIQFKYIQQQTNYCTVPTAIDLQGGKNYLNFQKAVDFLNGVAINMNDGGGHYGKDWIDASEKVTTQGGANWISASGANLTAFVGIQDYEDLNTGQMTTAGITNNGATLHLQGGVEIVKDGKGIGHGGGKTTVENGMRVDCTSGTHTNDWPVVVSASGMNLGNGVYLSPSSTYSIFSATPQTVNNNDSLTNNPANGNITINNEALPTVINTNYAAVTVSNLNVTTINYGGASGGVPILVASVSLLNQTANVGSTTFYTVPFTGMYRIATDVIFVSGTGGGISISNSNIGSVTATSAGGIGTPPHMTQVLNPVVAGFTAGDVLSYSTSAVSGSTDNFYITLEFLAK